eukprot:m.473049 g.473049  ORF g.473049 m.473049 type:complete len:306 (-) comp57118_c0_seq3:1705-2622(-)
MSGQTYSTNISSEEKEPLLTGHAFSRAPSAAERSQIEDIMTLNTHQIHHAVPDHFYIPDWRRYLVEFAATFLLVFFGIGGTAETVLSEGTDGSSFSSHVAWGLSFMFAVYVSASVSGGHLNPAVTFAMCVHKRFEWRYFPGYVVAQFSGAFLASALIYGVYNDGIHNQDRLNAPYASVSNGTASIWVPFPPDFVSPTNAFFDALIATSLFVFGIFAVLDPRNHIGRGAQPGLLGLLLTIIALSFGFNTGGSINPARDFGARTFVAIVYGHEVFSSHDNFFWIPLIAPFFGAAIGSSLYRLIVNPA